MLKTACRKSILTIVGALALLATISSRPAHADFIHQTYFFDNKHIFIWDFDWTGDQGGATADRSNGESPSPDKDKEPPQDGAQWGIRPKDDDDASNAPFFSFIRDPQGPTVVMTFRARHIVVNDPGDVPLGNSLLVTLRDATQFFTATDNYVPLMDFSVAPPEDDLLVPHPHSPGEHSDRYDIFWRRPSLTGPVSFQFQGTHKFTAAPEPHMLALVGVALFLLLGRGCKAPRTGPVFFRPWARREAS